MLQSSAPTSLSGETTEALFMPSIAQLSLFRLSYAEVEEERRHESATLNEGAAGGSDAQASSSVDGGRGRAGVAIHEPSSTTATSDANEKGDAIAHLHSLEIT